MQLPFVYITYIGIDKSLTFPIFCNFTSLTLQKASSAIWDINIQDAQVARLGRTHLGIKLFKLERRAARDFSNDVLVLYARTEHECCTWVSALTNASQRKLEDQYEVLHLIGEGGFAKVRLGRCLVSNEKRAIKTMSKAEAHAKVLGTEVAVIKRVNHPNIVKTYDVFETSEEIHIVMEYMEGGMLYDSIEDGVVFSEADVVQFMRELLDGVLYLHDIGIVHRDIKPENVLCTSHETPLHVKIADFGLSSISTVSDMKANRMLMSTMIGTPEFVAPEIARQETYTEKVDMWALGMLCYNVIARRLPLDESRDMITQIQEGINLSFPEPEWKKFSPAAQSFIRALLCEEADKRLTPLGCLVHPWVENHKPEQSTKFAAHGRMSVALIAPSARYEVMEYKPGFNVKHAWRKCYIAIIALCQITRSCSSMKMFGTARLRAMTMKIKSPYDDVDSLSNDSEQMKSIMTDMMRCDSAGGKSVSTTSGGASSCRVSGADDLRFQSRPNSSQHSNGKELHKQQGSRDGDFPFDDLDMLNGVEKDFDVPHSFGALPILKKWQKDDSTLRGMPRMPTIGMKVRAAFGVDGDKPENGRRLNKRGDPKAAVFKRSGSDGVDRVPYWSDATVQESASMGPGGVASLGGSRAPGLPDRKQSLRKKIMQSFDKRESSGNHSKAKWPRKLMKRNESAAKTKSESYDDLDKALGLEDFCTIAVEDGDIGARADCPAAADENIVLKSSSADVSSKGNFMKYLGRHKGAEHAVGRAKHARSMNNHAPMLNEKSVDLNGLIPGGSGRSRALDFGSPTTPASDWQQLPSKKLPFRK